MWNSNTTRTFNALRANVYFLLFTLFLPLQTFENVSILFSDVVGFTNICSQITPMEVVSMLNAMYTKFDYLSERHNVYKVCLVFNNHVNSVKIKMF